jgi:hypothetical protein
MALKAQERAVHTLSMNPKKRIRRCFPFCECVALNEPSCCSVVVSFTSNIVNFPRIWRRKPTSDILSQLLTCQTISAFLVTKTSIRTNVLTRSCHSQVAASYLTTQSGTRHLSRQKINRPRAFRMSYVDASRSNQIGVRWRAHDKQSRTRSPLMTSLKFLTSPWTTSSVCAAVVRDSSRVNLSSL